MSHTLSVLHPQCGIVRCLVSESFMLGKKQQVLTYYRKKRVKKYRQLEEEHVPGETCREGTR